jgi:DNA-binding NarL/FixJ family response regulator
MTERAAPEISVLVAEDNDGLRGAVCALIENAGGMRVLDAVNSVERLLAAARAGSAQVLVLDLDLAGQSSVGALLELRRTQPHLGVVVYSGHDRAALGPTLDGIGRCEYVTKTGDATELLDAIRRAAGTFTTAAGAVRA